MKNTIQIGDVVTLNAEPLANYHTYRDCSAKTQYTVTDVGVAAYLGKPNAVNFIDDVGDKVISMCEHVTKV